MERQRLNLWFVVAVCVALALLATWVRDQDLAPPPLPQLSSAGRPLAPGFSLTDLSGEPRSLEALRGRVVVLNFWATWCAPCREELPSLERLLHSRGADGLSVVAISLDAGSRESVKRYIEGRRLQLTVLHDPESQVGERYGVRFYPTTVLIDRTGRIAATVPSAWDWAAPEVESWLEALLEEGGSTRAGAAEPSGTAD